MNSTISFTKFDSPLGAMLATAERATLTGLYFVDQRYFPKSMDGWREDDGARPFAVLREQLDAYYSGTLREFDLPLEPEGGRGTSFQRDVWNAIYAVPLGSTTTYTALAATCRRPSAVRAAGAATGRNPISVIIPCHRIVGSDGSLTGYAGGLDRKRTLLAFEDATAKASGAGRPISQFIVPGRTASPSTRISGVTIPLPI